MPSPKGTEFLEEIQQLSVEELEALKVSLDADLAQIHAQLGYAMAERQTTGRLADPLWFAKASAARRYQGWKSMTLATYLVKRHKEQRQIDHIASTKGVKDYKRAFMQATKEFVSEETYARIQERADEIVSQETPVATKRA